MKAPAVPAPAPAAMTMSLAVWAMLVALSVLWGGSFFFVEVAVAALPPFTVVACRVVLAALTLCAVLPLMGQAYPRGREVWLAFFGMGLLNNAVPFTLITLGQTQIASGLASILNATTPLFAVLVTHLVLSDERASPTKLAGVALGFSGVAVMIGIDALTGLGGGVWGQLAVLGAALSYAFAGAFGRRFKRLGVSPAQTSLGMLAASSVVMLPLALVADRPWTLTTPGMAVLASLVALAVLSTAAAYLLYFRILAAAGATNVLLVTFLLPVSAILLGALILGERLEPVHFLGMALIGSGLAAIDGRPLKLLSRKRAAAPPLPRA